MSTFGSLTLCSLEMKINPIVNRIGHLEFLILYRIRGDSSGCLILMTWLTVLHSLASGDRAMEFPLVSRHG